MHRQEIEVEWFSLDKLSEALPSNARWNRVMEWNKNCHENKRRIDPSSEYQPKASNVISETATGSATVRQLKFEWLTEWCALTMAPSFEMPRFIVACLLSCCNGNVLITLLQSVISFCTKKGKKVVDFFHSLGFRFVSVFVYCQRKQEQIHCAHNAK